ncbi:MAG TPA: propionyl-CoA synthetase, partial [Arthrobacter bacterium]|nr:propionyl-CoA synthetase [Arthrobacter sp.]
MVSGNYRQAYSRSIKQKDAFWLEAAGGVTWSRTPETALDGSAAPLFRWFPDGVLNTSYNALDRHVAAGRGDQAALIYDSAMLGVKRTYSYAELTGLVAVSYTHLRAHE